MFNMQEISADNLNEVLKSDELVAFDFFGSWCGPCKSMLPIFTKVDKETEDITFYKVDVDMFKDLVSKYNVKSIPTVVILKKGKEIGRFSGSMSEEDVKIKLKEF